MRNLRVHLFFIILYNFFGWFSILLTDGSLGEWFKNVSFRSILNMDRSYIDCLVSWFVDKFFWFICSFIFLSIMLEQTCRLKEFIREEIEICIINFIFLSNIWILENIRFTTHFDYYRFLFSDMENKFQIFFSYKRGCDTWLKDKLKF